MKDIKDYMKKSVNSSNDEEWQVYVNGRLDKTFTDNAKSWKKTPKVGEGWYCGGAVFKITKIDGNKVYTEEEK